MSDRACDVLVIGSGIAGLYAALTVVEEGQRVTVVTKSNAEQSNTHYAQGGVAAALGPGDSPDLHARDTIAAGDGLCLTAAVSLLTREARTCITDLMARGVPFDKTGDRVDLTREAAHSLPRVIHAGGDATGAAIQDTLIEELSAHGVAVEEHALVTELVVESGRVAGARMGGPNPSLILAGNTILATGGAGQLYSRTTNPSVATGDGIALAYRAGGAVMDLEFFQFHPTALCMPGAAAFLISEAARGEGGVLRDLDGRAFMADYHPAAELAPRDVVARAIAAEMRRERTPHVLLDLTHLSATYLARRFPTIYGVCAAYGVDIAKDQIPVAPAAHYYMGGALTDLWGRTTIPGLYAVGEVACTGVHGANRLASNSLVEGLVSGRRAALACGDARNWREPAPRRESLGGIPGGLARRPATLRRGPILGRLALQELTWSSLGLIRDAASLENARRSLSANGSDAARALDAGVEAGAAVAGDRERHELDALHLLARLLTEAATIRAESRGAHFRSDHPRADPVWLGHIAFEREAAYYIPDISANAATAVA